MAYLISFVIFFIIFYVLYYMMYIRKNIKYDKTKLSADIKILVEYYKIDVEKIGYQKLLRIMNVVNSSMLSLLILVVANIDKFIYKFLILLILIMPSMWVTYYFLSKYLKYIERKRDNV